jgi:hypothetical protein
VESPVVETPVESSPEKIDGGCCPAVADAITKPTEPGTQPVLEVKDEPKEDPIAPIYLEMVEAVQKGLENLHEGQLKILAAIEANKTAIKENKSVIQVLPARLPFIQDESSPDKTVPALPIVYVAGPQLCSGCIGEIRDGNASGKIHCVKVPIEPWMEKIVGTGAYPFSFWKVEDKVFYIWPYEGLKDLLHRVDLSQKQLR